MSIAIKARRSFSTSAAVTTTKVLNLFILQILLSINHRLFPQNFKKYLSTRQSMPAILHYMTVFFRHTTGYLRIMTAIGRYNSVNRRYTSAILGITSAYLRYNAVLLRIYDVIFGTSSLSWRYKDGFLGTTSRLRR